MVRLMLKVHNITGLKYLCVTTKDNWYEYTGSGIYWLRHLNVHGTDISTLLILESQTNDDHFRNECLRISTELDIVNSKEFANLVPEYGLIGSAGYKLTKQQLEDHRKGFNRFRQSDKFVQWCENISSKTKQRYLDEPWRIDTMSMKIRQLYIDEPWRREHLSNISKRRAEHFKETGQIRDIVKKANKTKSEWSPEKRAKITKKRVASKLANPSWERSKKRMSDERKGKDNPAARKFYFDGKIFDTASEFWDFTQTQGYCKDYIMSRLDDITDMECRRLFEYVIPSDVMCPHCHKVGKGTSAFKRWHFDNCKENHEN